MKSNKGRKFMVTGFSADSVHKRSIQAGLYPTIVGCKCVAEEGFEWVANGRYYSGNFTVLDSGDVCSNHTWYAHVTVKWDKE